VATVGLGLLHAPRQAGQAGVRANAHALTGLPGRHRKAGPRPRATSYYAFELAGEGTPLQVIQAQIGHSSVATTDRYIRHLNPAAVVDTMKGRAWPYLPETVARAQHQPDPVGRHAVPQPVVQRPKIVASRIVRPASGAWECYFGFRFPGAERRLSAPGYWRVAPSGASNVLVESRTVSWGLAFPRGPRGRTGAMWPPYGALQGGKHSAA
jgi:hypothetical protein